MQHKVLNFLIFFENIFQLSEYQYRTDMLNFTEKMKCSETEVSNA